MNFLTQHPVRTLILASGLCLLSFLLTIPLPRVDNQLVGSDGIRYYAYLPSLLLDGDLDFSDEYTYFFAHEPGKAERVIEDPTSQGVPPNPWPIGSAVFWAPFFLLAHLSVLFLNLLGANLPTQGYGYVYQAFVLSGSIMYGGAGLLFAYRFARKWTTEHAALAATVLVAFAGNLVYYMTAEPSMAHTLSAFTSGLFFYTWMRRRDRPGLKTAGLYGLLGGLMALVRPQDGLLLALPFVMQIPDVWRSLRGEDDHALWRGWLRDGLVAGLVALIVFSPQMVVWGQIYGNYVRSPYTYQDYDTLFFWTRPKLGAVLFSAARGLFTWHPVFLLAVIGLVFACRRHTRAAVVSLLAFGMQWYVISSWHSWVQGEAFGGRMFIVCTPAFALGLAALIEAGIKHGSWQAIGLIGGALLAWNFLLFVEYRFELVMAQRPVTWYDITVGRVVFLARAVRTFLQ
jgi:hypothetical protein